MSIARVAIPATARQAAAATGASPSDASIVAGDFAGLLLGQMLPLVDNAPAIPAGEAAASDDTAAAPPDPAQLLASLGLPVPAALPAVAPAGAQAPEDIPADRKALPDVLAPDNIPRAAAQRNDPAADDKRTTAVDASTVLADAVRTPDAGSAEAPAAFAPAKLAAAGGSSDVPPRIDESIAAAGAAAHRAAASHPGGARDAATNTMTAALRDPAWAGELAQKVVWVARQDLQSAQITLNPPQLGPIEISLDVRNDQATAAFASANAEVREAIESALPRLREMFAGIGVELGRTDIGAGSFAQGGNRDADGRDGERQAQGARGNSGAVQTTLALPLAAAASSGRGLVDTFV